MAIGKKKGGIVKWAGGLMMIKEVQSTGADLLGTADTFKSLSYIKTAKIAYAVDSEELTDETGKFVKLLENTESCKVTGNFLQSDGDLITFMTSGCRGKYYALYRYEGVVDGKHQEFFFPLVQFKPSLELESGTKQPAFEIMCLVADAEITIDTLVLPTGAKTTADVVIPAGTYFKIVETAVS
jgi:hypothetical protein